MRSGKHSSEEILHQPFKDLKKLLQNKMRNEEVRAKEGNCKTISKNEIASPSARNDRNAHFPEQTQDKLINDEELFHDAMKEVREIREFREIPVYQKKTAFRYKCKNISPDQEALKTLEEIVKGRKAVNLPDTQEYIEWINQDYHEDIINRLHKGQYSVQDCLDLHGIIVEEAEKEVERFLNGALRKGYRCVKIIHGRGLRSVKGPVLKQALITWLLHRHRKNIIAFVTARQCDGGLGALYVLLR